MLTFGFYTKHSMKYTISTILILITLTSLAQDHFPEGFVEEIAYEEFQVPGGYLPTDSSIAAVWEIPGKLWIIKDGVIGDQPVIDITEEVAFWGDLGMVGAALDPNFLENGYVYLLYAVDRHYYKYFGTPQYDPAASEAYTASMGRLTRYTLDTETFQSVEPNSRLILLGAEIGTGIPICTASHGVGALQFGEDGSLLVTVGDGNTWVGNDQGTGYNGEGPIPTFGYDSIAFADGIISEREFLGGYRSQFLDGLNGKILRINPQTGAGIPNNPFYQEDNPNSPRSKTWALGFRNPYRMTLRPGTGYGTMEDGFPGILYVSDVGDWVWEEINVVHESGLNFGWPMFQGPAVHDFYYNSITQNSNAPNPLAGNPGCEIPFFNYQTTVIEANQFHEYSFPNPCDPDVFINDTIKTFVHERPALSYAHPSNTANPYAVIPAWDENGNASFMPVTDTESGVDGFNFKGISGSGGTFLTGNKIPHEYQGWYIQADYSGWLNAFYFDSNNDLQRIENWSESIGSPIHVTHSKHDGCIYLTSISPSNIHRICFGGNLKPVIEVTPSLVYGPTPQNVSFDASQSYDPEGGPLSFEWDFGDGNSASGPQVTHTFIAANDQVQTFTTTLTVSDTGNAQSMVEIPVSLNNTPPTVNITSITEGELYYSTRPTEFELVATVIDSEHSASQMQYHWQIYLHHNTHFHKLKTYEGNNQNIEVFPTGCVNEETYWYRIEVVVTDPGGLTASDSRFIYPDCDRTLTEPSEQIENFLLKPNPAVDRIELRSLIELGESVEYFIYSPTGKRIRHFTQSIPNHRRYFRIDISSLNQGVYILKFKVKDSWHQEKFVKTKG